MRKCQTRKQSRRTLGGEGWTSCPGALTMTEYALAHPWLTLLLALCFLQGAVILGNRVLRSINVALRGWPPAHLDADGDWKAEEESEE